MQTGTKHFRAPETSICKRILIHPYVLGVNRVSVHCFDVFSLFTFLFVPYWSILQSKTYLGTPYPFRLLAPFSNMHRYTFLSILCSGTRLCHVVLSKEFSAVEMSSWFFRLYRPDSFFSVHNRVNLSSVCRQHFSVPPAHSEHDRVLGDTLNLTTLRWRPYRIDQGFSASWGFQRSCSRIGLSDKRKRERNVIKQQGNSNNKRHKKLAPPADVILSASGDLEVRFPHFDDIIAGLL